jgi:hypothetical protein
MALLPFWRKSCCGFLSSLKVFCAWPILNPRILGPVAGMLATTPPRAIRQVVTNQPTNSRFYMANVMFHTIMSQDHTFPASQTKFLSRPIFMLLTSFSKTRPNQVSYVGPNNVVTVFRKSYFFLQRKMSPFTSKKQVSEWGSARSCLQSLCRVPGPVVTTETIINQDSGSSAVFLCHLNRIRWTECLELQILKRLIKFYEISSYIFFSKTTNHIDTVITETPKRGPMFQIGNERKMNEWMNEYRDRPSRIIN